MIDCLLITIPPDLNEKYMPEEEPFWLASVAAVIEKEGYKVEILDAYLKNMGLEEINEYVLNKNPKVIGIAPLDFCRIAPIEVAEKIIISIKKVLPKAVIGMLWSYDKDFFVNSLKRTKEMDFVVIGEPEYTMRDIVKFRDLKQVKGIVFRKNNKIIANEERELEKNLDNFPLMARHLLKENRYVMRPNSYKATPVARIFTSRGCPYNCTFCKSPSFSSVYRTRSVENVINEINYLIKNNKIKEVRFTNAVFTINKKWVMDFCNELQKRGIKITWSCYTRVDLVDKEMLETMAKAGCWNIFYGIESGVQKLLDDTKKGITLEQARNAVKWAKEAGMEINASFMLGLPGETPELAEKTIELAKELDTDYVTFHLTKIYEYTQDKKFKESGKTSNWKQNFDPFGLKFVPDGYKDFEELRKMQNKAFKEFYLRPKYLLKRLLKIRSLTDIKRNMAGLKLFLGI